MDEPQKAKTNEQQPYRICAMYWLHSNGSDHMHSTPWIMFTSLNDFLGAGEAMARGHIHGMERGAFDITIEGQQWNRLSGQWERYKNSFQPPVDLERERVRAIIGEMRGLLIGFGSGEITGERGAGGHWHGGPEPCHICGGINPFLSPRVTEGIEVEN